MSEKVCAFKDCNKIVNRGRATAKFCSDKCCNKNKAYKTKQNFIRSGRTRYTLTDDDKYRDLVLLNREWLSRRL
jgi:hypothetical protein